MSDFMMDFLADSDKAEVIRGQLIEASDSYYNDAQSKMSDEQFDSLKDKLREINPDDPWLKSIGAPVKVSEWKKAKHKIPMTSLNKANTEEEFRSWAEDIGDEHYIIMDKLDGFAIDLEYVSGTLRKAITRGDGIEGENILSNAKRMKNVKSLILNDGGFSGSLRGEVFLFASDFEAVNDLIKESGKEALKNPRNGATGTAKRFDGQYSEHLSVLYYDVLKEGYSFKTEEDKLSFITSLDLPLCFQKKVTVDEAISVFKDFENHQRSETKYDIDGLVIKANSVNLQKKHGLKDGNPKAQIAWKFAALKKETTLESVEWSLGNNQRITPVAVVAPTDMGGVTVTHASLHNFENFMSLSLGSGDRVMISRRNDVIPYLEEVIENKGLRLKVPDKCPECEHPTQVEGKFLICPNMGCRGLAIGTLQKWINALNILDVGPSTLVSLYNSGKVKDPADLYTLKVEDISGLGRMGEKTAIKILKNLGEKKELPLSIFIAGLNMNDFSEKTAMLLMGAGFDTIEKMLAIKDPSELLHVSGIEVKTANQIIQGLSSKAPLIEKILSVGITIRAPLAQSAGGKFCGLSFCFTGAIKKADSDGRRFTRDMMEDIVRTNGGHVASVTKTLSYLVTADPESGSTKTQKAKKLGIKILSEDDFFGLVGM